MERGEILVVSNKNTCFLITYDQNSNLIMKKSTEVSENHDGQKLYTSTPTQPRWSVLYKEQNKFRRCRNKFCIWSSTRYKIFSLATSSFLKDGFKSWRQLIESFKNHKNSNNHIQTHKSRLELTAAQRIIIENNSFVRDAFKNRNH